jgi:hypothetical protein
MVWLVGLMGNRSLPPDARANAGGCAGIVAASGPPGRRGRVGL